VFKTRIELRQIGVRDEAKIVGGIGICGRPLCCHSYLADFAPVSIKMAKEQNLSLNPTKISGICGRLMCCLKNEEETYEELNRRLPGIGDYVTAADGLKGEVQSVNVLRQLVKVVVEEGDEKRIKEYPADQLQFRRRRGKKDKTALSREEMQELERLEEEEEQDEENLEEARQNDGQRQGGKNRQAGRRRQNREAGQAAGEQRQNADRQAAGEQRQNADRQAGGEQRQNADRQAAGEQRRERDRQTDSGEQRPNRNRRNRRRNNGRPRQEGQPGRNENQSEG
jgi:hypothetical protein